MAHDWEGLHRLWIPSNAFGSFTEVAVIDDLLSRSAGESRPRGRGKFVGSLPFFGRYGSLGPDNFLDFGQEGHRGVQESLGGMRLVLAPVPTPRALFPKQVAQWRRLLSPGISEKDTHTLGVSLTLRLLLVSFRLLETPFLAPRSEVLAAFT